MNSKTRRAIEKFNEIIKLERQLDRKNEQLNKMTVDLSEEEFLVYSENNMNHREIELDISIDPVKHDHLRKIRKVRKERGLYIFKQIEIEDHSMIGKKYVIKDSDEDIKTVIFEGIYVEWYYGIFLMKAVFVKPEIQSHGVVYLKSWKTIFKSEDDIIRYSKDFELPEMSVIER
jgi:hypothetical protein